MNQPKPPTPQDIKAIQVDVNAYQAVLNILQDLPYKQAAPVLQALQSGSKPIFADKASIVDAGGQEGAE